MIMYNFDIVHILRIQLHFYFESVPQEKVFSSDITMSNVIAFWYVPAFIIRVSTMYHKFEYISIHLLSVRGICI